MFVCFVNEEYLLLKELWVNFVGGSLEATKFVGLDFDDPPIDLATIAKGFGAKVLHITDLAELDAVTDEALAHHGPTFATINRET